MAAVFPPPPPDPYAGLDGLERAWNRWRDWIMVDLPRQWDEFMSLLSQLGGSGGGGGGTGGGTGSSDSTVRHYPIPIGWALSDLSPADQITARNYIAAWPMALEGGVVTFVDNAKLRDGPINPVKVAVAALGWVGGIGIVSTGLVPWGSPKLKHPDAAWYPGVPFPA